MTTVRPMTLRWMIETDLPAVLGITDTGTSAPWPESRIRETLRHRNCVPFVVEGPTGVMGYMVYELLDTALHLHVLAVRGDARRQGVGDRLVGKLGLKLHVHRRHEILADVPESNLGAQLFFRAYGFRAVEVTRRACESGESVYRLVYREPGHDQAEAGDG